MVWESVDQTESKTVSLRLPDGSLKVTRQRASAVVTISSDAAAAIITAGCQVYGFDGSSLMLEVQLDDEMSRAIVEPGVVVLVGEFDVYVVRTETSLLFSVHKVWSSPGGLVDDVSIKGRVVHCRSENGNERAIDLADVFAG